ncbi:MAG: isoprenoid biosynthesis glyoxalase ElbB [Bacteroidales bacterium]|nr:isoprenoid biosynthesis glyoxalase ElbB [Bacteroidales bacterium]
MKKFAIVLAGCGVFDGAEIQEAVLTLLAIDKLGAGYQCFAPDILQHHVLNHITGKEMNEKRNVLVESARIARGNIKPMNAFIAAEYDALIFPGGFGCAKNLSTWAFEGDQCKVNPDVEKAVRSMFEAKKPIGAMCIAPVILGKLFKGSNFTTGNDPSSGSFIRKMGNKYTLAGHGEVVVDKVRNLFTTPCYMLDATISQIAEGTENIVRGIIKVIGDK